MLSDVELVAIMHLYRMDSAPSRTHAWMVTVQRRGRIYQLHVADLVYGGKRKALDAAKVYRDSLLASLRPFTRPERCRIKKKNNRSGVSGVTKIDTWEHDRGRRYHRRYWLAVATWQRQGKKEEVFYHAVR